MKNTLLFLFALLAGFAVTAQSLEMHYQGEVIPDEGAITVTGDVSLLELIAEVEVKNISNEAKDVKVKKYDVDLLPNTATLMCWVYCFAPNVYLSPTTVTIQPGETVEEFSAHYQPNNVSGVSIAMFTFFDENNPADSVCFYAEFNAGTVGVEDPQGAETFVSAPYPNPAVNQTSFDYEFTEPGNAGIVVMNMLGSVVKSFALYGSNGTATLDVSDLKEGVYFYAVKINGEVTETKKLVVSR